MKVKSLSRIRLFVIPWSAAYQAPPSMGFSRQEYWSGVPLPSPNKGHSKGHFTGVGHDKERTNNNIVAAQSVEETGFKSK